MGPKTKPSRLRKNNELGTYKQFCCRRTRIKKGNVLCKSRFSISQSFPYMKIDLPNEKKPHSIKGLFFHDHRDEVIYQRWAFTNYFDKTNLVGRNIISICCWHKVCFPDNFAPWNTLLQSGLVHFASQLTLLLNTLYSLTQFTPQHILLLNTHCSLEYFSPQHTLLHGTLCFLEHFAFCVPESKVCWGEKYCWERSVLRSKMCWGVKCVRE